MPELPEVETIRRQLEDFLPLTINSISYSKVSSSIIKKKYFSPKNNTIYSIKRKGKYLLFDLGSGQFILSHLGMSGSWRIATTKIKVKHTHLQFCCNNSIQQIYLAYVDPRRFGNIYFMKEKMILKKLSNLGVDVSESEFTPNYIYKIFQRFPKKMIKPFLLDQKYFAGIGNYMASEICGRAKILPTRLCGKISKRECTKIKNACQTVIDGSIKSNGLTFHGGYVDTNGSSGDGVENLVIFNQKTCGMCKKGEIVKVNLGGRGTYYCPKCQK